MCVVCVYICMCMCICVCTVACTCTSMIFLKHYMVIMKSIIEEMKDAAW